MFEDADDIVIPGFSGVELCAEDFSTKLSEPQPKCSPIAHVTVHQYTYGSQRSLRSSPLDVGRRVAEIATTASGWRTVNPPVFDCMLPLQRTSDPPSNTNRSNSVIYRDDRSYIYAPPVPVLPSDASPNREKEWGEPPSPDEIFSTTNLDEFVGTDFSSLHFFVPSNHHPEVHAASQYDPYAEVHLFEMQSMPHASFAFLGSVPCEVEDLALPGPSVIPGFAPEVSSMNSDAELYGEPHQKPATSPLFERDHPSSNSSDVDLYGSAPRNLSPPRGSDRSKSSQVDIHHNQEQIRKFDTSTLLHAIPEVRSHSMIYLQWLEADNCVAPFPSCAFCGSFYRSQIAHSAFQQKHSYSNLPKHRHKRRDLPPDSPRSRFVDYSSAWGVAVGWVYEGKNSPAKPHS